MSLALNITVWGGGPTGAVRTDTSDQVHAVDVTKRSSGRFRHVPDSGLVSLWFQKWICPDGPPQSPALHPVLVRTSTCESQCIVGLIVSGSSGFRLRGKSVVQQMTFSHMILFFLVLEFVL